MQNKKILILIVLSIAAVLSIIYGITAQPRARRRKIPSTLQTVSPREAHPPAIKIVPTKRRTRGTEFGSWGRNPFLPAKTSTKIVTRFSLSGIMWDKNNPKAILNGEIVGVGDEIGGNKVIDIKQNSVTLNDGTADFDLYLGQ